MTNTGSRLRLRDTVRPDGSGERRKLRFERYRSRSSISGHILPMRAALPGGYGRQMIPAAQRAQTAGRSGWVARLDRARSAEAELPSIAVGGGGDRCQQERVVIAGVEALQHASGEPVLAADEDRHAGRTGSPFALGEFVHPVAGLT